MNGPTAVVVGASADPAKYGNRSVRAHAQHGYIVYPVHPTADTIEGWTAVPSVAELPARHFDRVTLYLPPAVLLPLLDDIAKLDVGEVWFNPGTDTPAVLSRARELGLPLVVGCSIVALE